MIEERPASLFKVETAQAATRTFARLTVLIALLAPMAACSSLDAINPFGGEKYETKLLPDIPAQEIYDQGLARLQSKDYEGAAKKFGELEKQFPYSQWSRKGLLMQTFSHYQGNQFDDAVASANRYVNLYPTSEDTPYAAYLGLGIKHEAQTAAAVLGHNYPDGQWYKDAYDLLQNGGLEPSEDKGSWMSKIFKKVGLG
ncbi:MAG: outer membrane protein assembly factor BamD [Alphaproteobacteria bacterium]|nr:outer membrane protein assembly factor BamD [Alphaproteobacteria bacterium]